jgi:SAM-dependent methyltransferase
LEKSQTQSTQRIAKDAKEKTRRGFTRSTKAPITMNFKDHFSGHAADYRRFRPRYPAELFQWLAEQAPQRERAWDCATGSGQAACALASYFNEVWATDASAEQIAHARTCEKVRYSVSPAEESGFDERSVDLISVAQALHWFDHDRFYTEARRVMRPGSLIAVWSYNLFHINTIIDAVVDRLYSETLRGYWPAERRWVDNDYRDLPFPFTPVATPPFKMVTRWSLEQLKGYLGTWSAVRRYAALHKKDPIADLNDELDHLWGKCGKREVRWPLALRVGRN